MPTAMFFVSGNIPTSCTIPKSLRALLMADVI
jgi:hypothetical protein